MSTKHATRLAAAAFVVLIGGGCTASDTADRSYSPTTSTSTTVTAKDEPSQVQTSSTISVTKPAANESVSSPIRIEGTGPAGETVYAKIWDNATGAWLVESQVKVEADGTFLFTVVYFLTPEGSNLKLDVFTKDAEGNATNTASIPLKFAK